MSTLPPNLVGPILQAGTTQRQAARALENEREQQSNAAAAGSKARDRATEAIGEADNEARVHSESEGGGSQGREFTENNADQTAEDAKGDDQGIRRDDEGQLHVDLEA